MKRVRPRPEQKKKTVLIIDDQETVRLVAGRMMEQAGFRVIATKNGEEGLKRLRASPGEIDLVLLDLSLPDRHGLEILEDVRALRPDLPVILCSGYSERTPTSLGTSQPVTLFLPKPFDYQKLCEQLKRTGLLTDCADR
jgi:two-component system, cell cycle sensor histidine kinase and response regulator CckA